MTDIAPLVSVCIANYNGMQIIDDCLRSVMGQEGNISVEILVHDDASSDGSVSHIRDYYPDVLLIESKENVGFCVANNRMTAIARGRYLLLLNNDAALFPDALQTFLAEAKRLSRPAILSLPQYDAQTGKLIDIGCLLDPFCNPVPNLKRERNDVAMVIGACLWIPNAFWKELEGFPEWFDSIGEDLYICSRARLAGYPVRALCMSGYRHHVGQSFGGGKASNGKLATTFRRRALSERNKTFVLAAICPAPLVTLWLPLHLALLLLEGAVLSLLNLDTRYLLKIYLPAVAALFQCHRQLRSSRQKIKLTRCLSRADFFAAFVPVPHKLRMLTRHGLPRVR